MNRGDYAMVERILGQNCYEKFTPEETLQALGFLYFSLPASYIFILFTTQKN